MSPKALKIDSRSHPKSTQINKMGSKIRLASCFVSVATNLSKCVQQLEWATVFLCCFVKLRFHCCYLCNFQGSDQRMTNKKQSAWILTPGVSSKHRSDQGGKPKVDASQMLPRCFPDAFQMLPTSFQMPPRCPPDASRCFLMHPICFSDTSRCHPDATQMFPDASSLMPPVPSAMIPLP